MSYSFSVRATTKALAKEKIAERFAEVISHQVCHERDREPALAAAGAFIDLLPDDESKDVVVNMSGSLTGQWEGTDVVLINGASVSVSAGLDARKAE